MTKKSLKKYSKKHQLAAQKHHRRVLGISSVLVALLLGLILSLLILPKVADDTRLGRINDIYASFHVSEEYIPQDESIFGDKRVYSHDASRTFSSEKTYLRGANVDVTVKDLDEAIRAAGFTFIDEPYKGSTQIQYHYKSAKGEYVRLSVSSKLRDDAFQNTYLMSGKADNSVFDIDANAGPSSVTIKVNLDDNNE